MKNQFSDNVLSKICFWKFVLNICSGKRADGHSGMRIASIVSVGDDIVCDNYQFQLKQPTAIEIQVNEGKKIC